VLLSVRLPAASAVAALTRDDLANLETSMAVRDQLGTRWHAEHVRTPDFLSAIDAGRRKPQAYPAWPRLK
jgi:hypothetical protein